MDFELTETQQAVRETARAFARDRLEKMAASLSREERFPAELLRECAELGLLGVNVPERFGGAEAGTVAYALAMMEVAQRDASFTVAMGVTNMVAEVIDRFGNEAQRERWLPFITSGKAVCASFALSEATSASDAASLKTRAERRGDVFVLNGAKQWISHASEAGLIVVWARTDPGTRDARGISAFVVERGTRGMSFGRPEAKMGLRSSITVPVVFEDCAVPASHLLGVEGGGFKLAMAALDGGRIGIAAQACGVARAALAAARSYAQERTAFGEPIACKQAIAFYLADMAVQLRAAEWLALRAAFLKEQNRPFTREAAMAKLFASEMAQRVCDKAVQIHGGYGYTEEYAVERYFRDARVQTIYEGTSEIQRLVIARKLLQD